LIKVIVVVGVVVVVPAYTRRKTRQEEVLRGIKEQKCFTDNALLRVASYLLLFE